MTSPIIDAQQQRRDFEQARSERDRFFERYQAAEAEGDHINAPLFFERFEAEAARVERMRMPRRLTT
jgi:hypothetical protein